MKIVILGASGEIGTYIYQVLSRGDHRIVPVFHNSPGVLLSRHKMRSIFLDLRGKGKLERALAGTDVVVNCALDKEGGSMEKRIKNNVNLAQNIVEAGKAMKVKRLIHLSSLVVLPPKLTREAIAQPFQYSGLKDWYTQAKIETEKIFFRLWPDAGLTVIRLGIVYGAMTSWSKRAFSLAQRGKILLPNVDGACSTVHPIDIARLVDRLVGIKKDPPKLIHGVNPEPVTWKRFYVCHGQILREGFTVDTVPLELIRQLMWRKEINDKVKKLMVRFFRPLVITAEKLAVSPKTLARAITIRLAGSSVLPTPMELEMYQSEVAVIKCLQNGRSIGFNYKISFSEGVKNAGDWWLGKYVLLEKKD